MTSWDPELYRRFEDERNRPAAELLARVECSAPARVVDLGCGPATSTELLRRRWPGAELVGVDDSEAMLERARERLPEARFERGDLASWTPRVRVDVLFANASLHWVGDHARLAPRLLEWLVPGGELAFQVPDNHDEPTHVAMREIAMSPRFRDAIGHVPATRRTVLTPERYYDVLAPRAARLDVWRTTYHHRLAGAQEIVEWVRGAGLRPYLEPLAPPDVQAFLQDYAQRMREAYPPRDDGSVLLPFPRTFVVATAA